MTAQLLTMAGALPDIERIREAKAKGPGILLPAFQSLQPLVLQRLLQSRSKLGQLPLRMRPPRLREVVEPLVPDPALPSS